MKALNTISWLALIILMCSYPTDMLLWTLLLMVAAIVCYITKNEPARTRNTDKPKR